jgi:transcriptional regulator with XRE-family HTH domain
MNERLKEIRKYHKLSQEKFGDKLGVGKAAISKMELGTYNITDTMAKLICTEFNISYDWFVDGQGEMIKKTSFIYNLGTYAAKATTLDKAFITQWMNLDEVTKNQLLLFMKNIVDEIDGE